MRHRRKALAIAVSVGLASAAMVQQARAQTDPATQQKIDTLQKQIDELKQDQQQQKEQRPASAGAAGEREFLERKPGNGITFYTRGGEVSIYGNLDVSFDYATKGLNGI